MSEPISSPKINSLLAVAESAHILSRREEQAAIDRQYLERDIRRATKYATHEEIAKAITTAGRRITRQRVSQIAAQEI